MNFTKADLRQQVEECFDKGELSNRFALSAMQIAQGYLARSRPHMQHADRDAVVSEFCMRLVHKWAGINVELNVFSYLTQMTNYALMDYERVPRVVQITGEIDALEQNERDAVENRYAMTQVERDTVERVDNGMTGCDAVVSPTTGQLAMDFGIDYEDAEK